MDEVTLARTPRLVDELTGLQRQLARSLEAALAEVDLTLDQWRALRALNEGPDATMGALTERLQTPPPSTTRLVDGLVDRALVYRRPSDVDRRRIEAALSDAGRRLLVQAEAAAAQHERRVRDALAADLRRMAAVIDALMEAPATR